LSRATHVQHPESTAMSRSVSLNARQRQALLDRYRKDRDPDVRFRAHILLLLADGHSWATVCTLLFCSSRTIDRWVKRFHQEGVAGLTGHKPGRRFRFAADWVKVVVRWVTKRAPRDFGFLRSRWCCEAVALVMLRDHGVEVSRETVRRWLHRGNLVYRRPRPTLGPTDEEREAKLNKLRELLARLPGDETAVFQDEVDVNTNPKIGSMWMVKGHQAKVETPGNNEKRYLSGSIHWRSGQVFLTEGAPKQGRDTALFLKHLDELRGRLRRYRKIHVICDNAKCHTSNEVAVYLYEHRARIDLHYLPAYSPDCNPIERVWWNLHDQITRNHQCKSMEELLDLTFTWLGGRNPFKVEGRSIYQLAA
jgi:putative transposase